MWSTYIHVGKTLTHKIIKTILKPPYYTAKDDLELLIFLSPPIECWRQKTTQQVISVMLKVEHRMSHVLGKHSTDS